MTAPSFAAGPTVAAFSNALTYAVGTVTATDTGGSGVDATTYVIQRDSGTATNGVCSWNNTWGTITLSGGNDTVPADGCYRYRMQVSDNVSNLGTSPVSQIIVDRVAPNSTGSVTTSTASAGTYATGSTVFYRPAGAGGSFTVTDGSPTDANSGVAKVRFPGLTGGITPTTNTDVPSTPYANTYTWTTGSTDSGSKTITVFDQAGNSATTSFTLTQDSTAPTSLTTLPVAGGNYKASSYPTGWTGTASDGAGSGVANVKISLKDPNGNYYNGSIFTGAAETFNNATGTTSWTWTAPSLTTNGTYTVHVVSTDNVGNVEGSSTWTFVYDTTAPTFGALSMTKLGNCDANVSLTGTSVFYNPAAVCASAFKMTQALNDAGGSGTNTVAYPAIASGSFTHALDGVTTPFLSSAYGWSAAGANYGSSAQTQTLTGTDNAGNSATTTFTITEDTTGAATAFTAPAAGSAILNGATLTATANDGTGAGVKQVEFRYCAGASCTYAGSTAIGAPITVSPYTTTWSSQPADGTYTILARSTDNVGNVTDVTRTVSIDNTAPVYSSSTLNAPGTQVTVAFTEAGSGLDLTSTTPASAFTVLRNGSADAVTAVTYVDATHLKLTLTSRVFDGDTLTVAYSTAALTAAQKIKDVAGNAAGNIAAQNVTTSGAPSLAQTTVVASPTAITADGASTSTITVTLKNGAGTNVGASGGTVTLATTAGSLNSVTDNGNGTYTATLTSPTAAGSATVTAKIDGSSVTASATVSFNAGAVSATQSTIGSAPGSVVADGSTTSTITVTAKDAFGNPVGGQSVTLGQGAGLSTITTVSGTTNASGHATFTVKDTHAETVTYTATVGATGILATAGVTFTPGPVTAAQSTVSAAPTSLVADGATTSTVTVTLKDVNSNPVPGKTVTLGGAPAGSTITTVVGDDERVRTGELHGQVDHGRQRRIHGDRHHRLGHRHPDRDGHLQPRPRHGGTVHRLRLAGVGDRERRRHLDDHGDAEGRELERRSGQDRHAREGRRLLDDHHGQRRHERFRPGELHRQGHRRRVDDLYRHRHDRRGDRHADGRGDVHAGRGHRRAVDRLGRPRFRHRGRRDHVDRHRDAEGRELEPCPGEDGHAREGRGLLDDHHRHRRHERFRPGELHRQGHRRRVDHLHRHRHHRHASR